MTNIAQIETRHMMLNMGPSHPAMHGIIRLILELDGEKIIDSDAEIGYLHRAFEKDAESVPYNEVMPYTDRLNYVSPLINNFGFCMAVEKLLNIQVPERCEYIRVIMSEISRITDHLTCVGASAMELGAMSTFLYFIKAREFLYEIVEEITGARLTVSYGRIGGIKADLTDNFSSRIQKTFKKIRKILKECDQMLTENRIFMDRMKGVGIISPEDAINFGITGPFLRSTGIAIDTRKTTPYSIYPDLNFDIPTGKNGDNYDRYLVRMEEMQQSLRIIEQALQKIPQGPTNVDYTGTPIPAEVMVDLAKMGQMENISHKLVQIDSTLDKTNKPQRGQINAAQYGVNLPAKEDTYSNIEGLMNHFKLIMHGHGIQPPLGEAYAAVEGANGELGFYILSDQTDFAYKCHVRSPCFHIMTALSHIIKGSMVADIVPTFGSVNMIGGELDR